MDKIKLIKWTSTAAVLTGIALTNLNIYPVNIMIHGGRGNRLDRCWLSD